MTPGPVDHYLIQLERELRQRRLADAERIIEEAREHLADAVEDGRRRGLTLEDAEREALDRFGAADTIAADAVPERKYLMNRLAAVLETVWQRKWWILAPTLLTVAVTSALSYYLLPTRYRSESVIRIVSPRVTTDVDAAATDRSRERFQLIAQSVLSRTRLERIISDFDLYKDERDDVPLSEAVMQMRRDISVSFGLSNNADGNDAGMFSVSFLSSDPELAQKITERLTALLIEENLREKEVQTRGMTQFIESQIADVRRRIVSIENTLDELRMQGGRRLSQADLLPYEVLQERYKALLVKQEESRIAAQVERSQIGEQFVVIDEPRLPERPVAAGRFGINVAGTFAGLGVGLLLVRRRVGGRGRGEPLRSDM